MWKICCEENCRQRRRKIQGDSAVEFKGYADGLPNQAFPQSSH